MRMMRPLLLLFLLVLTYGCHPQHSSNIPVETSDSLKQARADSSADALPARQSDTTARNFMKAIDEPAIDTYQREVYRYVHSGAFEPTCLLRIERLTDSTYLLTSKFFFYAPGTFGLKRPSSVKPLRIGYYNAVKEEIDSLVFFADSQAISKKEWDGFIALLNGSYYWTFTDPMPDDGILDGDNLGLSSKSFLPRRYGISDTLTCHIVSIHCPFRGSFTEAYGYLGRKSNLFKKLGMSLRYLR